jgi:predicted flavoprotein YhiN
LENRPVEIRVSLLPGETPESIDAWLRTTAKERPTTTLSTILATRLPSRLADRLAPDPAIRMAHLPREERRQIVESIARLPLAVSGDRGYNYAEVTAGGAARRGRSPNARI